ncbi:hypothetical protein [Nocardioides sp.]|uniref:hypothetical protein n=1 Tax=Nocardioides sp. TaxID=35761 RepID=UPI002B84EAD3|nr:hypothetical protein [Nocardioides sp.]HSX68400.1 hypothetical protein [Nocardioides sp.]
MENQVNHARAALDVLAALQGGPVAAPEARREVAPAAAAAVVPVVPASAPAVVARAAVPAAMAVATGVETIQTRPRSWARRATGVLLLVSLVATGLTGWAAWAVRDTTLGGLALILAALAAGLWFLRVLAVPTTVSLLGPRLEITQAGRHHVWDLASPYSPVDHVRGRPGRPGWRVVLRNADGSTFTVDGSMVPAKRFTEILSRYRPEL